MINPALRSIFLAGFILSATGWTASPPAMAVELPDLCVNALTSVHRTNGLSSGEALLVAMAQISANAIPALGPAGAAACSQVTGRTSVTEDRQGLVLASYNGPTLAAASDAMNMEPVGLTESSIAKSDAKWPNGTSDGDDLSASFSPANPLARIISEIVLDIFVQDPGRDYKDSTTAALSGEILFREFVNVETGFAPVDFMLSPRPFIGITGNLQNGTSGLYFGLDWTFRFRNGIFAGATFGGIVHDGTLRNPDPGAAELGSRFLFRESAQLGYRFTNGHGIALVAAHGSNGSMLARQNQGINWLGLRYSYALNTDHRFGR